MDEVNPMTLLQQHTAAEENEFILKVEQAAVATAIAILGESSATGGHAERAAFSSGVLLNSREEARRLAHGVVTQDVDNESSDAAISNAVIALWNAYAGYNPN